MESISSLRSILVSTLTGGDSQDGEQELFDELSSNKKRLLNVFDFGPRNAEEQREIESGKVTVDGRSLSVNAEFARHVAFISQQVNCSERFVAAVLHYVLSKNPTIDKVEAVEQSVLAYHQLRRELADCLRFVFEAAAKAEEPVALPIHALLNDFVRRQLIETAGHGSITYRIFVEIVNLDTAIAAARIAVTNAVSTTNIPGPQAGNANLGQLILQARLESLLYERRNLAIAFYFIARTGYLASAELRHVLEWLVNNPKSETTLYILSAFFASLDLSHSQRESRSAQLRISITKDAAVVSFVKAKLAPTTEWKDTSLKATVSLKWTLFLAEVRYRDTSLEHVEGFRNEDLTMQVFNAVQADAFSFLLHIVSQLNADRSVSSQLLTNSIAPGTVIGEANEANGSMSNEFKGNLLHEIELLLRSLLTHAPAELRKVKHKQEDQFRPRADRHTRSGYRPTEPSVETSPPRNDIAILFQLLGQLYSVLPEDSAIQFWGGAPRSDFPEYYEVTEAETGRLPSFLRWAVEVREPDLIICVFDMLAGLSTGVACAECAYNFMAMGSLDVVHGVGLDSRRYEAATVFTWRSIFGELESWSALGTNQRPQHGVSPAQLQIAPTDVLLGLAFLKFTAAVAEHSVQARIAIATHPQYRTISCLVSLIPLGVPLELKGAIFETLSAFCYPGAGMQGVDICKNVWAQMERLEVINVRGGGFASKGVEVELEEVESVHRVYPATIAFLELLCTLIHTPKRVPLKNRVTEPEPINTVPENFGQPYRTPGIGPYVSFVVDNVLAKLPRREFLTISDSWKMADLSFCFLERCLASYDLESLPGLAEEYTIKGPEVLTPLVHHPGFDVLSRMLSETQLRTTLLTYVVEGAEELPRQLITSRFINVILRVLRITDRVLEIQDLFLDHLVPAVSEFDGIVIAGTRVSQSFLSRIDQGLSLDRRSIPAIGSYVTCLKNSEIKYMAVKILSSLSQSPSFQSIASLIERSQESTIILDGFVDLLGNDSTDDASDAEEWADLWTGAGAPDLEGEQDLFAQSIQLAILDLLLRGTKRSKSSSLAFLLLFGKTSPDGQVQDPHALGSRELCLHVILKLLNRGIPRLTEKGRDRERYEAKTPLFESQPVLAERLYKLVYQLCEHPRTSAPMMLYLRTREDFFARHLAAMAVHTPTDNRAPVIEVAYNDGSRVVTTCTSAKAFLQLRSWLLDLVSLELHALTNKGQNQRVKELLDLLFGTTETYHGPETDWEHDMFQPFNDIGQSRIRIIEIFQSLEFEWYDSVTVTPVDLQFYGALNLQSCIRTDESGCEVVDRATLFELLSNARRVLVRQGQVVNALHSAQLDAETKYVLESCVVENNRREVQFALGLGYESWKKLLDVVLTKCFNRISHDQRENILFDLLHVVPPAIHNNALPESSATLLAESLLLLVTKLREERKQAQLLSASDSMESSALPVERMAALLRHILDCILESHRGDIVRGNLYAALINFVHLAAPLPGNPAPPKHIGLSREGSLSNLTSSLSLLGSDIRHANGHSTSLEANCFAVIKLVMERLITTISKDAIDGTEVWKTIAFTLLESLTRMSHLDSRNSIFNTLDRYGLLSNFVHSIGEANSTLQDVLQPEPDDLNSLYVYETKMTFFIRLSQSRQGAERLLESRILPVLSHVDFLDSRPEPGESALDHDSFLPSTLSRYHQLFVPALQLAIGLVATLGSKHAVVSKQILDFIHSHRDTLVIMLKQDASLFALSSIQELDLIISLCALVVPSVPQTDFVATNSGFGSLHNAILAVTARTLGNGRWSSLVRPSDETEAIESNIRGSEYGTEGSKFDYRVRQVTQSLRRSTVNYLSAASSILDAELIVVLSPTLTPRDERTSGVAVALPSLKDAIDFLNSICDELLGTMQEIVDAASELEHRDHIRVDRIEELVDDVEADVLRKLDINQRRAFVCRILERSIASRRAQVESMLSTVEVLLHLLWRHLCYYASGQAPSGPTFDRQRPFTNPQPPLSASQAHLKTSTLRFLSMPDVQSFRSEASAFLTKLLEKVDGIEQSKELAGRSWRSSQTYLEIMSRCLREAVATDAPSPDDRRE